MKKLIQKIFKKKPKKLNLNELRYEFSLKALVLFEVLYDKSFNNVDDDDILRLAYCFFRVSNPKEHITQDRFDMLMELNLDFAQWVINNVNAILKDIERTQKPIEEKDSNGNSKDDKVIWIKDLVYAMIVTYGIDSHYVLFEMELYELGIIYDAIEQKRREDLVMERFWTFLKILPHIDSKKVKSPQDLLPFDFEKEEIKKLKERELKNNEYAIKNTIGKSIDELLGKK